MATASASDTTAPLYTTARAHSTTAYSRRQNPSKESRRVIMEAGTISVEAAEPAPTQFVDILESESEQTSSIREGKRPDVGNRLPVVEYDRTLTEEGLLGAHVWTTSFRLLVIGLMGFLVIEKEGKAYQDKIRAARVIGYDARYRAIYGPVGTFATPTPNFVANLFKNVDFVTELNSLSANPGGYDEATHEFKSLTKFMNIFRVHQNWLRHCANEPPLSIPAPQA